MGDIDKCFETWKKFRKYVKGSQNASKLFDSYFDHDKGDSSSIQGGLSCTASDIQQGNIWSGDTANAASDKILELLQEQNLDVQSRQLVSAFTGAWKLPIRFWNAMNIPAVIAPSIMEKPPTVIMSAPLIPANSVGRSFTDIAQSAVSCEAINTLV